MNKITGKVLHQQSLLGIPNLIIVIYDFDPDAQGALEETFGTTNPNTTNENPNNTLVGLWNLFPGDRLGSVYTDRAGSFELEYDDSAFRRKNEKEIRPDLFLCVLAHDTPNNQLPANSPLHRILYRTTVPIFNAGQQESFIIQLPSDVLESHGIVVPQITAPNPPQAMDEVANDYLQKMNRSIQLTRTIQNVQTDLVKDHVSRNYERKIQARQFASQLKKATPQQQANPLFLTNETGLQNAKDIQLEQAIARQQNYGNRTRIKLDIDINRLEDYLPQISPELLDAIRNGENATTGIQLSQLCKLLRQQSNTTELIRTRSIWQSIVQKYRSREIIEEVTNTPSDDVDPPPEIFDSLREEIRDMILLQMHSVNGEPKITTTSDDENLTKLQEKVNTFKLKSGPADATAYHDFHTLQIAFEHVWKEAFDEKLRDQVALLYEQVVKVREDSGLDGEVAFEDLRTMQDYEQFLKDMNADLNSLNGVTAPLDVSSILPALSVSQWNLLNPSQQIEVIKLAEQWKEKEETMRSVGRRISEIFNNTSEDEGEIARLKRYFNQLKVEEDGLRVEMNGIKDAMQFILDNPKSNKSRVTEMLEELGKMISEPYAFDLFYPNTVNFGILATYRQKWEPQDYQVGSLVSTIPLAPGESRKYSKKMVKKSTRAEKELQKTLSSSSNESTYTSRAQSEITSKASSATNFEQTAAGSLNFGIGSINSQTSFGMNQAQESAKAKQSFREAVAKASQEYKNERHIEINTSNTDELESSTSGEIKNTNNEITTTYLFYELERQYRISEHLHKMTPVIMVAQDVPAPHEIDEDWILAHEWILRRVLLDDMFNEALDYISDGIAGDEINIFTKKRLMLDQQELVKNLETSFDEKLATRDTLMEALRTTSAAEEMAKNRKKKRKIARIGKAIFTGGASLVIPSPSELLSGENPEARAEVLKANREAIERRLELLQDEIPTAKEEMNKSISALERVTKGFTDASAVSFRNRTKVDQLRIHLKQNILFYMQAIWDHEPPDQRFFRLYNIPVTMPVPEGWTEAEGGGSTVTVETSPRPVDPSFTLIDPAILGLLLNIPFITMNTETRKLQEIADLDKPLGYKGNYIIFPLKECVYLTDHMMQEYVDGYLGLRDPDDAMGDFPNTESLVKFTEEIYADLNTEERQVIQNILIDRLTSQRKNDELIVVPTGQLFIEALPGTQPLLEKFKLQHRRLDVEKVRGDVLRSGLENLRYLDRLEADILDDPETEKKVIIQNGDADINIEE